MTSIIRISHILPGIYPDIFVQWQLHVRRRRHRVAPPVWKGQIQCNCEVGLPSEHKDDQVDVSSPDQVNDGMVM